MRYCGINATAGPAHWEVIATDSLQTPDRALTIATDLVNTHRRGDELLRGPADLRRFLLDHAEPEPVDVTQCDLDEIRAVRLRLREVYQAKHPDDAAAVINHLLAEHASRPYLSNHDGNPWHVHVSTMDAGWAQSIAAMSAAALATVAADYGFEALRTCAADDCDTAFVTTSRQRIRRYCSQTCGARTRVSSHRARLRGDRAP